MNVDQSNSDESQTTEALVPMVDLFAVLALVFMIYSTDEIATAKLATESQIQEIVATAEREIVARVEKDSVETINTLVAKAAQDSEAKIRELELKIEEDARARATYADMSLEALLKQREAKTQQLAQEIAELLTLEDSRAAIEYEGLVSDIAYKYDEELEQQKATLQQIRERELAEQEAILEANKREELEAQELQLEEVVANTISELTQDKAQALSEETQRRLAGCGESDWVGRGASDGRRA